MSDALCLIPKRMNGKQRVGHGKTDRDRYKQRSLRTLKAPSYNMHLSSLSADRDDCHHTGCTSASYPQIVSRASSFRLRNGHSQPRRRSASHNMFDQPTHILPPAGLTYRSSNVATTPPRTHTKHLSRELHSCHDTCSLNRNNSMEL